MEPVLRDFRLALRRLRMAPGFTLFAVTPVVKGLVLGLGAGIALRVVLRATVVTGVSPVDFAAFAVVPIPFALAALLACYVPASRASRVDPNVALRDL